MEFPPEIFVTDDDDILITNVQLADLNGNDGMPVAVYQLVRTGTVKVVSSITISDDKQ